MYARYRGMLREWRYVLLLPGVVLVLIVVLSALTAINSPNGPAVVNASEGPNDKRPLRPEHRHAAFKERLEERLRMVALQIQMRRVKDPNVLKAMRIAPRHAFIPPSVRRQAYYDHPLPIGEGQTISQPYIVAFMTEALKLDPNSIVLEIGTGSGYQAAVCAEIAREVYTIEIVPELAKSAAKQLKTLGYRNVFVKAGDGYFGWPDKGPFDVPGSGQQGQKGPGRKEKGDARAICPHDRRSAEALKEIPQIRVRLRISYCSARGLTADCVGGGI